MKKFWFNMIVLLTIAILLGLLELFNLLEKSGKFMLVPIFTFYILGQYSERKFKK